MMRKKTLLLTAGAVAIAGVILNGLLGHPHSEAFYAVFKDAELDGLAVGRASRCGISEDRAIRIIRRAAWKRAVVLSDRSERESADDMFANAMKRGALSAGTCSDGIGRFERVEAIYSDQPAPGE